MAGPQLIAIGKVLTAQGRGGEVRVFPLTDFPGRFLSLRRVYLGGGDAGPREMEVEHARLHGRFVVVKLAGVEDPEAARLLHGQLLQVTEDELVPLPEGHYYIFQLVGLPVYTVQGEHLGVLSEILATGANDVYRVLGEEGQEVLVPALRSVVREIDLAGRRVVVDLPEGLRE